VSAPGLATVGLNTKVLGFALGIATVAALAFGLLSAFTSSRPAAAALASPGRAGISRHVRRLTSSLVVAEIALAVVLLLGAGLVLRSFASLLAVDPGFDVDRVATFDIGLPGGRYPNPAARAEFYQRAVATVQNVAGVEAVGMAAVTPLTGNNWTSPFERADKPLAPGQRPPDVGWQNASAGYFRALGIPLKSGRLFDQRDAPGSAPTVIISEAIEKRFFGPGESAVGHFLKQGNVQSEIIGVVGDIRRAALTDEPRMDLYLSFERLPGGSITVFVRTTGDPASALPAIHAAFRSVEPNIVMINNSTLAETAARSIGTTRLTARFVRGDCRSARRRRHLRSAVARGPSAHAGDRYATRDRRPSERYPAARLALGRHTRHHRHPDRRCRRAAGCKIAGINALQRKDHRPARAGRCRGRAPYYCARGSADSGTPGGENESREDSDGGIEHVRFRGRL
jgi:hypothetical protein